MDLAEGALADFDPERARWGLCEAVMNTAPESMLAQLHRDMIEATGLTYEPVPWWIFRLAPPAAPAADPSRPVDRLFATHAESGKRWLYSSWPIETDFRHKLYDGRLTCWGRPGSCLAEYARAPAGAVIGVESWWEGGGIVRLTSGEQLYTVSVEQPNPTRGITESKVAAWIDSRIRDGMLKGEDAMWDDFRAEYHVDFSKSRFLAIRKTRMAVLGVEAPRPGRPARR
jgi:hypothetical protein